MRPGQALLLPLIVMLLSGTAPQPPLPVASANDNRTPAGRLRDGVLTISLDATLATWHPDGDSLPGLPVEVFAEVGKRPSAPGPLVRVPVGTEIRATVRNSLERDTLTFFVPARIADAAKANAGLYAAAMKADQAAVELARTQLGYATIRAPFDGIAGAPLVYPGAQVSANSTDLVVLNQVQPIHICFAVHEARFKKLEASMPLGRWEVVRL